MNGQRIERDLNPSQPNMIPPQSRLAKYNSQVVKRLADSEAQGYFPTFKKLCRGVGSAISSGVSALSHPFASIAKSQPRHSSVRKSRLREQKNRSRVFRLPQTPLTGYERLRTYSVLPDSPWNRAVNESRFIRPRRRTSQSSTTHYAGDHMMETRRGASKLPRFTTTTTVGKRKRETTQIANMDAIKRLCNSFARSPWAGEAWTGSGQSLKREKHGETSGSDVRTESKQIPTPDPTPTPTPERAQSRHSLSPSESPDVRHYTYHSHSASPHQPSVRSRSLVRNAPQADVVTGLAFDYRYTTPETEDERPYIQRVLQPRSSKFSGLAENRNEPIEIDEDEEDDEPTPKVTHNILKSLPSSEPIRPIAQKTTLDLTSDGREYDIKNDPVWLAFSPPPPLTVRQKRAERLAKRQQEKARAKARQYKENLVDVARRTISQESLPESDDNDEAEIQSEMSALQQNELEKGVAKVHLNDEKVEEEAGESMLKTPKSRVLTSTTSNLDLRTPTAKTHVHEHASYGTPKSRFFEVELTVKKTRRAEQIAQIEAARDQYKIVPLDKAWENKVKHAINHGHNVTKVANSKLSFDLKPTDLARLVPAYSAAGHQDNWLNDESINAYMELVAAHGRQADRPTQEIPSHHSFNSFFYPKLRDEGPKGVTRWAKRAKIGGHNLLKVEKVFVPINQSYHWTLGVISGTKKTIMVYNSLGSGSNSGVANNLLAFVKAELGNAFKDDEWQVEPFGKSSQQGNADDCGVFTVTNARQLVLEKVPHQTYTASDIAVQRRRIVAELIAGKLLKAGEGVDG